jgi:hypothetical protein
MRALLLALLLAAASAEARLCKRRRATNVAPGEWSLNATPPPLAAAAAAALPANFSWGDAGLLAPSWNQHIPHYCGSCFLHATLSMVQDRLKIAKAAAGERGPDAMLARQAFLNCAPFHGLSGGCDGGDVIDVLRYMAKQGLPDESCVPYAATDYTVYGKKASKCPAEGYCTNCMPLNDVDTCWAVRRPPRYTVSAYGTVAAPGEGAMLEELAARGPITCSMATPEAFDYGYGPHLYPDGVATDPGGDLEVDHDVEVVGWGETAGGKKYWVVRNSWGSYWGRLGFFLLERGANALQIEAGDCWWATPEWDDEKAVRNGTLVGSMWGLLTPKEAARARPEPGRRPHEGPAKGAAAAALALGARRGLGAPAAANF